MKRLILGMSAATLLVTAAFANESAQVASLDNSPAAFSKLDMDQDGRVSAIEAANDSQLAAVFIRADEDQDGYLSAVEFQQLNSPTDESTPKEHVPQQ